MKKNNKLNVAEYFSNEKEYWNNIYTVTDDQKNNHFQFNKRRDIIINRIIEFAGENLGASLSRIREVPVRENLVVLRTFSKWAGLAGLRIGYGAFPKWLMPTLWKSKQPYNTWNKTEDSCRELAFHRIMCNSDERRQ